ncbi:hypothetical protein C8J57DRAFT_1226887 [Mycena rebaudengoi]|nr:hypothetical protein C8J57DRAFT_1226887 [Mycena rebaudengoi]
MRGWPYLLQRDNRRVGSLPGFGGTRGIKFFPCTAVRCANRERKRALHSHSGGAPACTPTRSARFVCGYCGFAADAARAAGAAHPPALARVGGVIPHRHALLRPGGVDGGIHAACGSRLRAAQRLALAARQCHNSPLRAAYAPLPVARAHCDATVSKNSRLLKTRKNETRISSEPHHLGGTDCLDDWDSSTGRKMVVYFQRGIGSKKLFGPVLAIE